MFRILGFILGSAVSIAGIFMVLGVPDIHLSNEVADQVRFDAALQKIRERQVTVEEVVESIAKETAPVETVTETMASTAEESLPEESTMHSDTDLFSEVNTDALGEPQDVYNPQQRWHEFWNPFRSEIAAQGFVSQLEKVTGLDYRVIKVEAGVYQVGFAYSDDDERRFKISQISAATGLDLPQT
jgi:hypothetical protein